MIVRSLFAVVLLLSANAIVIAKEPVPPAGFEAIFNGRDLAGWYGLNPHSVGKLQGEKREANLKQQREEFAKHWSVENGELVNVGTGPYATSEKEYGDIELLIEYKTVAKADSGIYLRGTPQVQIWDINQPSVPERPDRNPNRGSGGLFNNTPKSPGRDPLVVADKPFGEWNAFRIRQVGAHTWVWLNDKLVVDGAIMENFWDRSQPLPAKGPIMLQTHGGEIRWRNLFVREIGAAEAEKLLPQAKASAPESLSAPEELPQPKSRSVRTLEGWKIRVDDRLLQPPHEQLGTRSLRFLEGKLFDIQTILPAERVAELRTITIVLDLNCGKLGAMQYHPSAGWLTDNGYPADLEKCVHLPRAEQLPTRRNITEQPWVILHELAHAYHDQVLGFDDPRVKDAYANFQKSGHGDATLLYNGNRVKHYALTNHKEFFAEMTESYFGLNDFFPFNGAELQEAEPETFALLTRIWKTPAKNSP